MMINYDGPRPAVPWRVVHPKAQQEEAFGPLGPTASVRYADCGIRQPERRRRQAATLPRP